MADVEDPARFMASPDCEIAPFGDGVAILDLRSNTYFSLNESGRVAFEAMSEARSASEVTAHVAAHFGIPLATCEADVARLLDDLVAHRLVTAS